MENSRLEQISNSLVENLPREKEFSGRPSTSVWCVIGKGDGLDSLNSLISTLDIFTLIKAVNLVVINYSMRT